MNKKRWILLLFVLFVLAWTPWISEEAAKHQISSTAVQACGMDCSYCGVTEPKKVPFGYEATMEKRCNGVEKKQFYLSLLGTVHGL